MGSAYEAWKKRQRGRPILLVFSVLGFAFPLFGTYYYFYKPWAIRRRLKEAEGYAEVLLQSSKRQ